MRWNWVCRGLAAALLLACVCAGASGLQVAPIGLAFTPASPAQGLWLTNTGGQPLQAQVRVFRWSQADGKDELVPTQALLASPPMLSLAADGRQLVRIIRTGAATPATGEEAYRVLIDELPEADPQSSAGVQYVLRYSVPVFVQPAGSESAAPLLQATLETRDGHSSLVVRNTGAVHAQLANVSLLPPTGEAIDLSPGLLGYVLPGMTMRWPLTPDAHAVAAGAQLKVRINGEPVEQTIPLSTLPR